MSRAPTYLKIDAMLGVSLVVGVHVERFPSGLVDGEILALRLSPALPWLGSYPRHTSHLFCVGLHFRKEHDRTTGSFCRGGFSRLQSCVLHLHWHAQGSTTTAVARDQNVNQTKDAFGAMADRFTCVSLVSALLVRESGHAAENFLSAQRSSPTHVRPRSWLPRSSATAIFLPHDNDPSASPKNKKTRD